MILATKSEMFGKLLYYRMKEDSEPKISFPTINSSVMGTILEYFYTGSIKDETLTKYNIIEPFDAADCFQLLDLQKSSM
uniref:BTB domain-containing protein n=1 Tax=Rhizophagus irregularis (strain DAOM 181602 / DAOM 197198 / MUCL 43194) TaxID=747089 RepID=U9TQS6_RHIID